jgi:type IV pilus assembly protein PilE
MDCTMRKPSNFATARRLKGFTLIELMIAVSVATILTVIAVPSYINTVRKSHRTEAKSILLDIAGREERYLATNGSYSSTPSDLGFTGSWPQTVGSGYYQISVSNVNAATVSNSTTAATPATFLFTATAINGQTKDTQCAQFTVNQSGVQGSLNSAAATSTGCW